MKENEIPVRQFKGGKMIFRIIKCCFMVLLTAVLFVSIAPAQSTAGRFLFYNPSAISNGMGGIGVADDRSAFATYFNPAGIAFGPTISACGSYVKPFSFFDNVEHSYFAVSANLKKIGAIGLSMNVFWKGSIHRTDGS
jgi:hypothetical protein